MGADLKMAKKFSISFCCALKVRIQACFLLQWLTMWLAPHLKTLVTDYVSNCIDKWSDVVSICVLLPGYMTSFDRYDGGYGTPRTMARCPSRGSLYIIVSRSQSSDLRTTFCRDDYKCLAGSESLFSQHRYTLLHRDGWQGSELFSINSWHMKMRPHPKQTRELTCESTLFLVSRSDCSHEINMRTCTIITLLSTHTHTVLSISLILSLWMLK